MAKDGTNRGGARLGAGRKKKPLAQKIQEGQKAIAMPAPVDLQGVDMPSVKEYLSDEEAATKPWHRALGIDILNDRYWGKGYGRTALEGWIRYLRERGLRELYLQTWSGNERMIHVAKKLGFRECARRVGVRVWQGQNYDALTFRLCDDAPGALLHGDKTNETVCCDHPE